MTKQNRFFKPLSVALAAALAIGSLAGCGESETEKQARLYREYIANGGNPIPQAQAPMAPAQQPQAPATVVVQQAAPGISAGEAALLGMAAGAFMTHAMMSPRGIGESDYDYGERRRRWDAEDARIRAENRARYERQKAASLRNDNGDLRRRLAAAESQNRSFQQQAVSPQKFPAPVIQPAVPQQTRNDAMFAQKPKDGTNFSRQQPMPVQPSVVPQKQMTIPTVQKPAGGGMFGSSGGSTSRSSTSTGSSSRSSTSRSK